MVGQGDQLNRMDLQTDGSIGGLRTLKLGVLVGLIAEVFVFVVWGLIWFPAGSLVAKAFWALACGLGMGLAIGESTRRLVVGRLVGRAAYWAAAGIAWAILVGCATLCFFIDRGHNLWGSEQEPLLFLVGGYVPAIGLALLFAGLVSRPPAEVC